MNAQIQATLDRLHAEAARNMPAMFLGLSKAAFRPLKPEDMKNAYIAVSREQGELIYSGPWTDVVRRARTGTILHVSVANAPAQAAALLSQNPNIEAVNPTPEHIEVSIKAGVDDYSFVPQQLIAAGFKLTMLKEEEVNLETAFMRLTKGMVQ